MPELPEVETVMRGLAPVLEGQTIRHFETRREGLRFAFPQNFSEKMEGRKIIRLQRRAKYILAFLDDDHIWLSHLGMTGRFTILDNNADNKNLAEFYFQSGSEEDGNGKHDHVLLELTNDVGIVYTDPRRFGVMDHFHIGELATHRLLANLGVEPLGNELNGEHLKHRFENRKTSLKSALLDQKHIAGLGNIYVCEALYRARLSPKRMAGTITGKKPAQRELLVTAIRDCLNEAIVAGGSTLSDYAQADGTKGSFQQRFDVYDREGKSCHRQNCGGTIKRIVQSGRSTFYCPDCQK